MYSAVAFTIGRTSNTFKLEELKTSIPCQMDQIDIVFHIKLEKIKSPLRVNNDKFKNVWMISLTYFDNLTNLTNWDSS